MIASKWLIKCSVGRWTGASGSDATNDDDVDEADAAVRQWRCHSCASPGFAWQQMARSSSIHSMAARLIQLDLYMATVTVTVATPMLLVMMMMMAATTMTTTRTKTMTATCFFTGYGESAKLQRVNTAAGLIHRRPDTAVWYAIIVRVNARYAWADTADLVARVDYLDKSPVDVVVLAPPVNPGGVVVIPDVEVTNAIVPIDAVDLVGIKPVAGLDLTEHNVANNDRLWMQYRLVHADITRRHERPQRPTRRPVLH